MGGENSNRVPFPENENDMDKEIDAKEYERMKANEAKQKEADEVRRA